MAATAVERRIREGLAQTAWVQPLAVAGILLSAALIALWPLFQPGLPETTDLFYHLLRPVQLDPLLRSGWLYPRWAPNFVYGYGYPIFNYYAPSASYLMEGLHLLLGLDFEVALKVVHMGAFVAYAFSMYVFARRFLPRTPATVAAVAYLFIPFHLRELYGQGDLAQHLAYALVPLAFAAVYELAVHPSPRSFAATMLAASSLVLTHNITAFISAGFLGLYCLLLAAVWGWRRLIPIAMSAMSGAMLTAFFWLPAMAERDLVQLWRLTQGFFRFDQHFVSFMDLIAPSRAIDQAMAVPIVHYSLGLPHLTLSLLSLPGFGLWRRLERAERIHLLFAWMTLLVAVFLMLPISTPVWERAPLMSYVEFPWRFLAYAGFSTAILVGLTTHWLWQRIRPGLQPIALPALILLLIVPNLVLLYPRQPFLFYNIHSIADVNAFERKTGLVGSAAGNEYFPKWVVERPGPSPDAGLLDPASMPPGARTSLLEREPLRQLYTVDLPTPAQVTFEVFYFPGWQMTVDGVPVPLQPVGPYGFLGAQIPPGEHQVELFLGETTVQRGAEVLSAVSLLSIAVGLLLWRRRRGTRPTDRSARTSSLGELAVADPKLALPLRPAVLTMAAILALLGLKQTLLDGWSIFSYASPPGKVIGVSHPTDVVFGNRIRLLGYDLDRSSARPGGDIQVILYWQNLIPIAGEYHSYVKLARRNTGQVFAQTDHQDPGTMPALGWHPDQVQRDVHILHLPADLPPMAYQLYIGLYTSPGYQGLPASGNSGDYPLDRPIAISGNRVPPDQIAHPLVLSTDQGISSLGYSIENTTPTPGQTIALHFFWRGERQVDRDYTVFVHLLDASNRLVAQADSMPLGGDYRTTEWIPGDEIDDVHQLAIPPDLAPGIYHLQIGWYDAATGQRLNLHGPDGQISQQVTLEQPINVQAQNSSR